jgi:hypothetical protein
MSREVKDKVPCYFELERILNLGVLASGDEVSRGPKNIRPSDFGSVLPSVCLPHQDFRFSLVSVVSCWLFISSVN